MQASQVFSVKCHQGYNWKKPVLSATGQDWGYEKGIYLLSVPPLQYQSILLNILFLFIV